MKRFFMSIVLLGLFFCGYSQTEAVIHHGTFKKKKMLMSSNPYKPDDWEKPFYDSSLKSVFPSDLVKHPDKLLIN